MNREELVKLRQATDVAIEKCGVSDGVNWGDLSCKQVRP